MLLSLCYPVVLLLFNRFVIQDFLHSVWIKDVLTSLVCLLVLLYAVGFFKQPFLRPSLLLKNADSLIRSHPWAFYLLIVTWLVLWALVWLSLPLGWLLAVILPIAFFLCSYQTVVTDVPERSPSLIKCLLMIAAAIALLVFYMQYQSPYLLGRLFEKLLRPFASNSNDVLLLEVFKAWFKLNAFSASHLSERVNNPDLGLIRLMGEYGYVAGTLLSATILVGLLAVYKWLKSTQSGGYYTPALRKLGLVLLLVFGAKVLVYVLFNFGLIRANYSGLSLFESINHSLLLLALIVVIGLAIKHNYLFQMQVWQMIKPVTYLGYAILVAVISVSLLIGLDVQRQPYFNQLVVEKFKHPQFLGREEILDGTGTIIAHDVLAYDLYLNPSQFFTHSMLNPKHPDAVDSTDASRKDTLLSALKPWPHFKERISQKLSALPTGRTTPVVIAWAVKPKVAQVINSKNFRGVQLKKTITREYPQGSLYAHTVGFVAPYDIGQGQEGVELVKNNELFKFEYVTNHEWPLPLNLQPKMQQVARDVLKNGIEQTHAIGGAMIVVDYQDNHKIKALVSAPEFDPSKDETFRNPYQPERILNRATSLSFPIGDLLTPLLLAQGLQTEKYTANNKFKVGGQLNIGKEVLLDLSAPQEMSLQELANRSSDVAFTKNGLDLTLNELESITLNLGIGQPLRINGLTSGVTNEIKPFAEWDSGMQSRAGWFIETNLMQVMLAYTPFISGRLQSAYLIRHDDLEGSVMLSPEVAEKIRDLLSRNITIKTDAEPKQQMTVALKTTTITGKRDIDDNGETSKRNDVAVLVAMLPKEKPKFLVGILLEFPHKKAVLAEESLLPVLESWAKNLDVKK